MAACGWPAGPAHKRVPAPLSTCPPPPFLPPQDHVVFRYEAVLEPPAGRTLISIDAGRRFVVSFWCAPGRPGRRGAALPACALSASGWRHLLRSSSLAACLLPFARRLADQTLAVFEPPQANTGITGGKFLERGELRGRRWAGLLLAAAVSAGCVQHGLTPPVPAPSSSCSTHLQTGQRPPGACAAGRARRLAWAIRSTSQLLSFRACSPRSHRRAAGLVHGGGPGCGRGAGPARPPLPDHRR